jgi:6-phosphogluconate dehydrogenase
MQLGMIGLGRMGANILRRVMREGHPAVAYDVRDDAVALLEAEGAVGATTLDDFVAALEKPRVAWVMIPAGITDKVVEQLADLMDEDDIIINGGNSNYREDIGRAAAMKPRGIHYVDVGTSGGVWGLERGYCLMIGGEDSVVAHLDPLFNSIAPGVGSVERTAGRSGDPTPEERGYLHCGPSGAGHFVKMVHNGIEYGMMAAYAEGLNVLKHANAGAVSQEHSAEVTPLEQPLYYQYDLDISKITEVWRRGSVVASWLLDLTAGALHGNPQMEGIAGRVSDSGEGRWTSKPPSTRAYRCRCCRPPCSHASAAAARPSTRTSCCPPCARPSAAT